MAMTTTSFQLTAESPTSSKVTATFIPHYYEVQSRLGLTLEIEIGYQFSGKTTLYPSYPNPAKPIFSTQSDSIATKVIDGGSILVGIRILCVLISEIAGLLAAA